MTRLTLCTAFWVAFDALWKPVAVLLAAFLLWLYGPFLLAALRWSFGSAL